MNDAALVEAIGRLRGEWAERSGGTLSTAAIAWPDLIAAESPDADVILFPSRYLGELCEKKWLRPVRENVLQSEAFNAADIYPLVRRRLITYDKQVYALPLGMDLPVMCYRGELFNMRRPVPRTWVEYQEFIRSVEQPPEVASLPPIWEPTRSWGAVLLLARAAGYLSSQRGDALFDTDTMKPQIAGAVFIRALQELAAASKNMGWQGEPKDELDRKLQDPRSASWNVATGYAQFLAIGLPPAGHRELVLPHAKLPAAKGNEIIRWTQLPGASEVFEFAQGWQRVDRVRRVPLLAAGDRLAAVTALSRNAASAFQLLQWLSQSDVSSQFARAGVGTMPVRQSLAKTRQWYDEKVTAEERADLAAALSDSLSGEECLMVPRIPGVDEYLAALAEAVEDVVVENGEPSAALEKAARTWELITERHGREGQRKAYLRHLGVED